MLLQMTDAIAVMTFAAANLMIAEGDLDLTFNP